MSAERCNEHGVYAPDEVLALQREVKGWRGMPTAEIELRNLGGHWIWSASFQLMQGDHLGSCEPLVDREPRRAADRHAALYCAKAQLLQRLSERAKEPGDARRIMIWLDGLERAQGELFAA